jgi:hypothetical protein
MAILDWLAQRSPPLSQCQRVRPQSVFPDTKSYLHIAFRVPNPLEGQDFSLADINLREPTRHVYSRYTQQVSTRAEHILSRINASPNCRYCDAHSILATTFPSPGRLCDHLFIGSRRFLRRKPVD